MKKVFFHDPEGNELLITDMSALKRDVIDNFDIFWMQGSGDGYIEYFVEDKKVSTLMLGPNIEYGLYLHYIDEVNRVDLLSLNDEENLNEVAETADEIYASIGLFLPKEEAWEGIQFFVETGKPLQSIKWITPDDIPETGNW